MRLETVLVAITACASAVLAQTGAGGNATTASNSTILNPILPGFHPDPSCIYVPEWDQTFFCASSSFNAFPGIPIHASKDLQNWKLIGHVLNRREQLPRLAETNRSTSGIWAPTLRFNNNTFWLVTTLVDDDRPQSDEGRWDNIIFKGKDPYNDASWSNATHFNFVGYDTEPFWDVDSKTYITGAHAWQIGPYIQLAEANLDTGAVGEWRIIWNGTGGMAPEGPHIYHKDGWYYLLAAEGGTGVGHMVTMARSKNLHGPYESNPANPVLTNANTTSLFQTVGHADLFQDGSGNWWGVALSTRSGPAYVNYPMGRETVLTAVRWPTGEFPVWTPIAGEVSVWPRPATALDIRGDGQFVTFDDDLTSFSPETPLPLHITHWRYPNASHYTLSPPEKPSTLRLTPSYLNLTGLNGNYAGALHSPDRSGQTLLSRRQTSTTFSFSVDLTFHPTAPGSEAGVTAFLTQNHHIDMGILLLPRNQTTFSFESVDGLDPAELVPQIRVRAFSYVAVPEDVVVPVPPVWWGSDLTLQITAEDAKSYLFSIGPAGRAAAEVRPIAQFSNDAVSWGFTGVLLGVYSTRNGYVYEDGKGKGGQDAVYVSRFRYTSFAQARV